MANVSIKPYELEQAAAKFDDILGDINTISTHVNYVKKCLTPFSGFGIENVIESLERLDGNLELYSSDLTAERDSLRKIIKLATDCDNEVYKIFNVDLGWYDDEKITITHEDWEKLIKQFKYYSQRNNNTKDFLALLEKFRDLEKDTEVSVDFYRSLRDTFNFLIHKDDHAAFVYSNVDQYFAEGNFKTLDGHYGLDLVNANGKAGITKLEYAYGCDGTTTVYTIELGTLTGTAKLGIDWFDDFMKENAALFKESSDAKNDEKKLELIIAAVEAKIGASLTGATVSSVTTRKLNDKYSIYSSAKLTVGELSASAAIGGSAGSDGIDLYAKAKAGASAAKLETNMGLITNNERVTVGGGMNIGQEWGAEGHITMGEPKGKIKGSAGMFSAEVEIDDGLGYYTFLDI